MNKNDIRLLTCNNLFITYYMLKKNQATKLKYRKVLMKLQSNSSRQIWRQASAHQLKYNVQPDRSNQIITMYLIGEFKPVKWYDIISPSKMISYDFTGIIFIYRGYYMPARGYEFYLLMVNSISHWWDIKLNTRR